MQGRARPAIAPPEEDPNAIITCSSPPCFLHELDPSWLGYLRRDEVAALLGELLAAEWAGTVLETAWLRAMLRRHLARLGARAADDRNAAPADDDRESLARRLREASPRVHDDALRRDLTNLLLIIERDTRGRRGSAEPG
jgi:hypothetical protein